MAERVIIILQCSECKNRNYHLSRGKKTREGKLELRKFCAACGHHTVHKQTKSS